MIDLINVDDRESKIWREGLRPMIKLVGFVFLIIPIASCQSGWSDDQKAQLDEIKIRQTKRFEALGQFRLGRMHKDIEATGSRTKDLALLEEAKEVSGGYWKPPRDSTQIKEEYEWLEENGLPIGMYFQIDNSLGKVLGRAMTGAEVARYYAFKVGLIDYWIFPRILLLQKLTDSTKYRIGISQDLYYDYLMEPTGTDDEVIISDIMLNRKREKALWRKLPGIDVPVNYIYEDLE